MADLSDKDAASSVKMVGASSAGVESNYVTVDANGAVYTANRDSAGQVQYNFPAGFVRVTDEPTQVFYDPFDTTLDTTNRWNTPTTTGTGVAASVTSGVLSLGTGGTANSTSQLSSIPTFTPTVPSWLGYSFAIKLESPVVTNTYRFWGTGTAPGTPTSTAPLTDACGFEIDTLGKLHAVVYAAGVRTSIQDLSAATGNSKQPTDANYHRYIVYYRTDRVFFYIDSLDTPVATSNFQSPNVQTLPIRLQAIAHSSPPAIPQTIQCTGLAVWDTGKNNQTLSDGTFGWRKATVKPASTAAVATDTALVVAVSPNNTVTIQGQQGTRNTANITTSTSVVGPYSCSNLNVATVSVSGTYAGVSFVFEASDDGTNYYTVNAVRNDLGVIETGGVLLTNTTRTWDLAIGGFTNFRVRATAYTSGTAAVGVTFQAMPYEPTPAVTVSPIKPTYMAATAAFTPPATPTDLFVISGSATKAIKILRVELTATQTTAGINTFFLAKRSTANTAGTAVATTKVPTDSAFASATATVQHYTANPTTGVLVGNIKSSRVLCPAPASVAQALFVWDFEAGNTGVPPVLRGTGETLALNFAGAVLPAGLSLTIAITWTEE